MSSTAGIGPQGSGKKITLTKIVHIFSFTCTDHVLFKDSKVKEWVSKVKECPTGLENWPGKG